MAGLLLFSHGTNAVILNNINGIDYQWLELTETHGLSRDQVESRLADPDDALYGYRYASRSLVEALLLSYAPWDGIDHYHGDPVAVAGVAALIQDFGALHIYNGDGVDSIYHTLDGYSVPHDSYRYFNGLYGKKHECGIDITCQAHVIVYADTAGNDTLIYQQGPYGWDSTVRPVSIFSSSADRNSGSFLVKSTVVPIPAALWLFCAGLMGLVAFARKGL